MGAKIVRDRVDALPWKHEECKSGLRRTSNHREHLNLMRQKILEEVGELIGVDDTGLDEEFLNEAADVYQAMCDYLALLGISDARMRVIETAAVREATRGGFTRGLVLET